MKKVTKSETATAKPKSLWDHLNEIYYGQRENYFDILTDVDKKTWNTYMINRFISMETSYIEIINIIQKYSQILSPEYYYKALISVIPKRKLFNKYIKGKKDDFKIESWLIDIFKVYYEVSSSEATEYIEMLLVIPNGKDEIISICKKYGKDEKEIKKLKL